MGVTESRLISSHAKARRLGLSIPEMLFAVAIGGLLLAALASVTMFSSRSFYSFNQYSDMNASSAITMDRMSREIRACTSIISASATQVVLNRGTNRTAVTFTYDPDARTLTRSADGESTILLTECTSCQFAVFQKNPIPGSFEQLPATSTNNAKIVAVNWSCSREVPGQPVTTEESQSARIVLRQP